MIEVLPSPTNVAAFRLAGTVTGDEYDRVIDTIESVLDKHEEIGLYVDALQFEDMTAEAIKKRMQYGLKKLGDLRRFKRAAIVTDKEWLGTVTSFLDRIFPQIQTRAFKGGEEEEALEWVAWVA